MSSLVSVVKIAAFTGIVLSPQIEGSLRVILRDVRPTNGPPLGNSALMLLILFCVLHSVFCILFFAVAIISQGNRVKTRFILVLSS